VAKKGNFVLENGFGWIDGRPCGSDGFIIPPILFLPVLVEALDDDQS